MPFWRYHLRLQEKRAHFFKHGRNDSRCISARSTVLSYILAVDENLHIIISTRLHPPELPRTCRQLAHSPALLYWALLPTIYDIDRRGVVEFSNSNLRHHHQQCSQRDRRRQHPNVSYFTHSSVGHCVYLRQNVFLFTLPAYTDKSTCKDHRWYQHQRRRVLMIKSPAANAIATAIVFNDADSHFAAAIKWHEK